MSDQPIELMPLETLHADAAYLVGRAVNGTMEADEVVTVIRSRIDAARAALAAQGQDAEQQRIGRVDVADGRVRHFAFEQTDLPTGSYSLYAHPPRAQAEPPGNAGEMPEALIPARPDLDYLRSMATGSALPAMLRGQIMAAVRVIEASAALARQPGGQAQQAQPLIARPLAEWHENDGPAIWWAWCGHEWAGEPAWCGTPLCSDWPGYHTHWTPHPAMPAGAARQGQGGGNGN